MRKIFAFVPVACLIAGLALPISAQAQLSPGGDLSAPKAAPENDTPLPLPAAIPGAGDQRLQTTQSVAKQQSGDPTTELFTAINAGDYSSAQDAISRGADLNGQNALGETPIDLSVALNRNSITFMLLAARNDAGDDSTDDSASAAPAAGVATPHHAQPEQKSHAMPVKLMESPGALPGNDPGTPNSSAGFLGFSH